MSQYLVVRQIHDTLVFYFYGHMLQHFHSPESSGDSRLAFTFHSWLKFPRVIAKNKNK